MRKSRENSKRMINRIEVTNDLLTGRGEMALFSKYLDNIGIGELLGEQFSSLRKSQKGLPVAELFKQIFC